MSTRLSPAVLVLVGVLTVACASDFDGPTTPAPVELPPDITIQATAYQLYPDGSEVTCSFRVRVAWDQAEESSPDLRRFIGRMGGESSRKVLDSTGAGLAFFADMAWPTAEADVFGEDSVAINLTAGGDPSGSPFWDAFSFLGGSKDESGRWTGPWTCHPMGGDTGGYVDTTLTAVGSWEIVTPFVQRP